ncbi:Pr6Pr family membrane protein [Pararhodobacter zhoushanensis]|uniref:Pr6Pr family membrane protein n=1 Tax=Pararhodobacter zhoushanensis TaxID=2479545 RepID=UPI000F8CE95A|nr:Pr6Pr family membrane protein [Pararhodobacter zhoushanensis]
MTPPIARAAAALIALIAFASIYGQLLIMGAQPELGGVLARLWVLVRFFTILTNGLTGIAFALIALGWRPGDGWLAGIVLSIAMVGGVYHTLLVPDAPLTGPDFWTDLGYHTLVPLGAVLWWLIWGGKALSLRMLPFWLIWPLAYCLYALARGQSDGIYPYFFLDLGQYAAAQVALNIVGLCMAFALGGLALLGIARLMRGLDPDQRSPSPPAL